jgi:eukaryotic-like serine/threonine-protein kinase
VVLPPGSRLGPYEIVAPIGEGGMGEVYRARDTRLDRTVAIKVLLADFAHDPDRRQRFEREARLVASLNHPQICALHDVGDATADDGSTRAYLVMEYLEGETLADRIARGPLPLHHVAQYGAAIAHALDAAHRQHIVHRDLKPGNVMLTKSGVKLLDFGLAKAAAPAAPLHANLTTQVVSGQTMAGTVMGTVPYMAPEQLEGKAVDERSDIFALGAVLYEMATGARAFAASSAAGITSAVLTADPPEISSSHALERIVRPCLAKDPEARWRSAHDVALQLESLRGDQPTAAAVSTSARLPWVIAAAAVVLALASLGWAMRRSSGAADVSGSILRAVAFPLVPPPGGAFMQHVESTPTAVAPDGSAVA